MSATKRQAGVRGRPRDADRDARRDALIETAMHEFLDNGYGQTSIEAIAGEARVAKRTIYAAVGDKADLFVAVVRRLGDLVVHADEKDERDLRLFCIRLTELMLSDEAIGLHRLVIAEAPNFTDVAQRLYANGPQRHIDVLETMVGSSVAAEQLFTLLLGERQRRRLFCLEAAPTHDEVVAHVDQTLDLFNDDELVGFEGKEVAMRQPTLFLTVGLPATGKTTAARRLEVDHHALRLTKDEWMKALYGEQNPPSVSDVIEGRLVEIGLRALELGINVVIDFGLWGRDERSALRQAAADRGASVEMHYFEVSSAEQRRRLDQRQTDEPHTTWPISDEDLVGWADVMQIPTPGEVDGSEAIDDPPAGFASWEEWRRDRWPHRLHDGYRS